MEAKMLIEFSVDNYKVFNSLQTLSMLAKKSYKEHMDTTMVPNNFDDLLINKSAIIYGANGAGKSSLVEALDHLQSLVLFGFASPNRKHEENESYITRQLPIFRFDEEAKERPTTFDIVFIADNEERYNYHLSMGRDKVEREALWSFSKKGVRAKTIFTRLNDKDSDSFTYYCPSLDIDSRTYDVAIDKAQGSPRSPFLSILSAYEVEQIKPVVNWFSNNLSITCNKHDNIFRSSSRNMFLEDIASNNSEVKSNVLDFLKEFDFSITDLIVKRRDMDLPESLPDEVKKIFLSDMGYSVSVEQTTSSGKKSIINYDNLSSGTKKLIDISAFFLEFFSQEKNVLVFDEFETSLHPYLVRKIFQNIVKNKNTTHQIILTTHSTVLLDTDNLVRRDQVWFLEKGSDLDTELYPLSDFSPKKEDSIIKGWNSGRFGGVPFLG